MAKSSSRIEPRLAYEKAISMWVIAGMGKVSTVREVDAGVFASLIRGAANHAEDPEACASALAGLQYQHLVDRWYAINTLGEYGAAVPLFATSAEAIQHQHGEQSTAYAGVSTRVVAEKGVN